MKKQSIFKKILNPLMLLLILEVGIIMMSVYGQGLFQLIRTNSREIIESRVEARRNYLESIMVNQWMNVGQTVQKINRLTDGLVDAGKLDIESIDDSSENAASFLNAITDDLLSMMRTNRVTGVFLILNADDLKESMSSGKYVDKPGLYFRDLDPESKPSVKNFDLLIERSPYLVVRNKQMTTDTAWNSVHRECPTMISFMSLRRQASAVLRISDGRNSDIGVSPINCLEKKERLLPTPYPCVFLTEESTEF